jgi:hypothetical protein
MTNSEIQKQWQYLRLCFALTMHGFRFTKANDTLSIENTDVKRLYCPFTHLPYSSGLICTQKTNRHYIFKFIGGYKRRM